MSLRLFILVLILSNFFPLRGQTIDTVLPKLSLERIALINQSDSYITFPIDIGNIEPLMFEANINPSFVIRKREDSKLLALLTPQIRIRMYDEESFPIRTPSYIPKISVYYLLKKKNELKYSVLFGTIAHHSNGQDGDFYNEDGSINLMSGNFSTNYLELGIITTGFSKRLQAIKTLKSSLEIHPKYAMAEELRGIYSGLRWKNTFTSFKFPLSKSTDEIRAEFSLKAEVSLMLDNYNDLDFFDFNRVNANLTFYYHPKFLADIGFFVQFYHGMDYYNIYFDHQLSVIRFGLMTEILRF